MSSTIDTTTNKLNLKIFVGFRINSEIRMHLNYSDEWKQELIIRDAKGERLEEIRYQEKQYIGILLPNQRIPLYELRNYQEKIRNVLYKYCPELNTETVELYVFPQLFLS
jgi:hypothetical protein